MTVIIKKTDDDEQVVFGEVYAPNVTDSHGDFMREAEIKKMAYGFLQNQRGDQVDENHDHELTGSYVVESFIARKGDDIFIPGSWVVGIHIPDPEVWEKVKNKEINGFSLEANVKKVTKEVEIEVPEMIKGKTSEDGEEPHDHVFKAYFNDDGEFIGGETDEVNGHKHLISKGTVTDESAGHAHHFSFIEGINIIQEVDNA